jgi:uncharacterized protein YgbK (DUF1537 family)
VSDYILADDLSGALETGAAFHARGWRATLPMNAESVEPSASGELQILSTETRAESPARAAAIVRAVVAARRVAGSRLLFKKIDSTLRGPVGAELAAVIDELKPPLVVVCPANPAVGRVVRNGILLVNGTPLAETDFRHDPQYPALSSAVEEVLQAQGVKIGTRISAVASNDAGPDLAIVPGETGTRVVVCDAETDSDLAVVVERIRRTGTDALFVGSAALAAALAGPDRNVVHGRSSSSASSRGTFLAICGSGHPASFKQLEFLRKAAGVVVIDFLVGSDVPASAAVRASRLIGSTGATAVRFTAMGSRTPESARAIQTAIGEFARLLFEEMTPGVVFLTGGETAWNVCTELNGIRLEVIDEPEAGVVCSKLMRRDRSELVIVTKPGGYGSENAIHDVFRMMMK